MTSKLLRKLQTTTRKITAEFGSLCGRQEVCRVSVLFAAALVAGFAGAAENTHSATWQSSTPTGNVPLVRIDSVEASTDSQVVPVSYAESSSASRTSNAGSASSDGLKWVAVGAPKQRAAQPKTTSSSDKTVKPMLVTPIPSVMPRYSYVRQTAGEEELNLDGLEDLTSPEAGTEAEVLPEQNAESEVNDAGAGPLAMPAMNEGTEIPAMDSGLDAGVDTGVDAGMDAGIDAGAQNPGAIGNEEGSMLNQGGLEQNTLVPLENNNSAQSELPSEETVKEPLPEPTAPMELPSAERDPIAESFSSRQVDEADYDMPCESSEPMHRITEITNDIELHDHKIVPKSCPLAPEDEDFPVREFPGTNFTWTASNLCHNPLYFEQPDLERYGHSIGPLQPVLSGTQFLLTIPALPMVMAIDPPNECQYALGYNRPGSCAPHKWSPIPFSVRGAIATGGVATALVFLIP